ncbi:unnamed protein product [Gongylonema pulchrum]|uniref:Uncharacterized protein n=1 Tax=Gongylonema pulchrum TaxID=637853 RepID=A0A183E547_9BILA|nr:unnamed protein product [Gongylonema pulchrum]
MEKLGKVWTKLSTTRRPSQTRPTKDIDMEGDAPVDTKKVFELFAETPRSAEHHRHSNTASGSGRPATATYTPPASHRKHQSLSSREKSTRAAFPTVASTNAIAEEWRKTSPGALASDLEPPVAASTAISGVRPASAETASTSTTGFSKFYRDIPVVAGSALEPVDASEEIGIGKVLKGSSPPVISRTPIVAKPIGHVIAAKDWDERTDADDTPTGWSMTMTATLPSRVTFTVPTTALPETNDYGETDADRQSPCPTTREIPELSNVSDAVSFELCTDKDYPG